jgi:hypothetical protein
VGVIELENEKEAGITNHLFDPKTALPKNVILADPHKQSAPIRENGPQTIIREGRKSVEEAVEAVFISGVLSLSEIAFDKTHKYAIMSFSFACGRLCGHGETIVFEEAGGEWQETKRAYGFWIS